MDKREKEFLIGFYDALLHEFCQSFMFETFVGDPSYENFKAWVSEESPENEHFNINWGLTKGVIIHHDLEWVLKIPFGYQKNNENHCRIETHNYQNAIAFGVEDMFAETHYLMDFFNLPCYVMRKVECGEFALDDHGSAILGGDEYSYSRDESESEELVEELICAYYGEERFNKYCRFCKDNGINDIHEDNIGWIGNRPIVIDYSGF
jgi:hypothetical protein